MRGDGIEADRYSYNGLLTAHANAKPAPDAAAARGALSAMEAAGVAPDLVSFNSLITALGRAGDLEGALRTLKGLGSRGLKPDAYSYTAAIGACADNAAASGAAAAAAALGLLDEMSRRRVEPTALTYSRAIAAAAAAGGAASADGGAVVEASERCVNLLEAMSEAMLPCTAPALNAALGACAAAGRYGDGLAAVRGPLEEADHAKRAAPVDAHTIALLDDLLKAEEAAASAAAAPVDGGGAAAEKGFGAAAARGDARAVRAALPRLREQVEKDAQRAEAAARETAAAEARFVDLFFGKGKAKDLKFGDE